jgi:hypothetical protein
MPEIMDVPRIEPRWSDRAVHRSVDATAADRAILRRTTNSCARARPEMMNKHSDAFEAAAFGLLVALAAGLLVIGRQAAAVQAAAERQMLDEVPRENADFCEQLGIRPGMHRFVICTMGLNDIRERQINRIAATPTLP